MILSKITKIKVREIENIEKLELNDVYVIAPNNVIEVIDGHIQLFPAQKQIYRTSRLIFSFPHFMKHRKKTSLESYFPVLPAMER